MNPISNWFRRHFNNPQVIILVLLLTGLTLAVMAFAGILLPFLVSLVITYLLLGPVRLLERLHVPRLLAVVLVSVGFLTAVAFLMLTVVPVMVQQAVDLARNLPSIFAAMQTALMELPEKYPALFDSQQMEQVIASLRSEVLILGQRVLGWSVTSLYTLAALTIYAVLVPLLVFFMLKDRERIVNWMVQFLPEERPLADRVWRDVDRQLGNYIRGKVVEIIIVGLVTYIGFMLVGLNFSLLLAVLTGLSVLVPYIGATVVTLPVAVIAYVQFGLGPGFLWAVGTYLVIQALDGNVLVPVLFSEVVNLHPVAIIVAILFFGGVWGFWGIVFAIPLATVVQAVLAAWPESSARERLPRPTAGE